uniref:Uncharacterized protein n=1 Tax=Globisporangium ultimum (strain ATCC 200006 / CBS 805.95 / DAOM BR144) TaxID=431595 RepID=K3WZT9_GLOUD
MESSRWFLLSPPTASPFDPGSSTLFRRRSNPPVSIAFSDNATRIPSDEELLMDEETATN